MRIKITDESALVSKTGPDSMQAAKIAMNKQLRQWAQYWYTPNHYVYNDAARYDWEILVTDNADIADALGYHDVSPDGKPYGKVFVEVCRDAGVPWISVLSHEVLELVGDPGANQWANDPTGRLWAFEMCDAVQNHLYDIDGVMVSDFVTPNYFIPNSPPPYDHLGVLSRPFSINGGYSIVARINSVSSIFGFRRTAKNTEVVADAEGQEALARPDKQHPASRTHRRLHTFDNT